MVSEAQNRQVRPHVLYLFVISLIGIGLVSWGLVDVFGERNFSITINWLIILMLLAAISQLSALLAFQEIDLSVASAIALAAIPLFGPRAAVLVAAVGELGLWSIRQYRDRATLKERGWVMVLRPLGFNVGMWAISILAAGLVFTFLIDRLGDGSGGLIVAWFVTAVVADQVNMWLLVILLNLLTGIKPTDAWNEHRWAIPINVLVPAIGGGILAQSIQAGTYVGVIVFFFPIILSAFALHLYASGIEEQKNKLEKIVQERTTELEKANDNLRELSRDKDQFLAILTHDMRTPLTSIKGYTSIVRDRELPREKQQHIAKIILRAGDNLLELVNNILEIENFRAGGVIRLEKTEFDLAGLTLSIIEVLKAVAEEKNIALNIQAPPTLSLYADKSIVQRIITNLISNAVKYTPEGGDVEVVVRNEDDGFVAVSVQDTGYGIPEEDLPHIFDEYQRVTKHAGLAVGTGLGLAIVKNLIEAHQGQIYVESEEDVGTLFTIKLPLRQPARVPLEPAMV